MISRDNGLNDEAASRRVKWTLLNSVLYATAAVFLYGLAVIAYLLFYHNYLPDQVTNVPIHLQYGFGKNPYGAATLAGKNLKEDQAYDVAVTLTLPRSPPNLDRGNFMVTLYLLDRDDGGGGGGGGRQLEPEPTLPYSAANPPLDPRRLFAARRVLHAASRPALLPYADPLTARAARLLLLPYRLLAAAPERATLHVPVAEGQRLVAAPAAAVFLELHAGQDLHVYDARVTFTARLAGLRWAMYRHRLAAFAVLTLAFWACELAAMTVTWMLLSGGGDVDCDDGDDGDDGDDEHDDDGGASHDGPHRLPPAPPPPGGGRRGKGRAESRLPAVGYYAGAGEDDVKDESAREPEVKEESGPSTTVELTDLPPLPDSGGSDDEASDGDLGLGTSYKGHEGGLLRKRLFRTRT